MGSLTSPRPSLDEGIEKKSATPPVRQADIFAQATFRRFFNTGIFSDLILKFSGRQVLVHKTILSAHSRWFGRALEGQFTEASQRELEIHDDAPDGVWGMLRFFYDMDPLAGEEDERTDGPGLVAFKRMSRAVTVWIVGDKYDVPGLGKAMHERFNEIAKTRWVDVFLAGKMGELLDEVHTAPPVAGGSFQATAKSLMFEHLQTLHDKSPAALRELLSRNPELAVEVSMAAADSKRINELGSRNYQERPLLHDAAQKGDLDEVVRLIDGGLEVDVLDKSGETPLHLASRYGHAATARYLVMCGANVNAVSKRFARGTPLMWAKLRGNRDVKEVLERADALEFPHIEGLDDD